MKITFVIPNAREVIRSIPLGPLCVASYLRREGYHDISIIDARHKHLGHAGISRSIKDLSPDVVGISGLSMESSEIHSLAGLAKAVDRNCKVIVGGPYATSSPERILKDSNVDFVIIGEGERTTARLINALQEGKDFSEIDGLAFKNNGTCVVNPVQSAIEDLDAIPFPAWDLIDMEGYFKDIHNHSNNPIPTSNRIAPLFTSRGCPYRCTYCHNIFGKKIRFRSVGNVMEEIEALVKRYRVQEIEIIDDCFNFDLPRAKEICDEIIRRGIKITLSFPNALRVDRMDEELIIKLKQAGTYIIFYAIESASPTIQQRIKKNLDLEKAKKIINYTADHGIVTCGYFMLGFPGETKEEMLQTVRFAKDMPFHIINMFYVTPPPNTEMFNDLFGKNGDLRNIKINCYQRLTYNASAVTDHELQNIWSMAHREFYFRPGQMWRIWKAIPDKRILLRNGLVVLSRILIGK
ncbi:MAG: radical SAM protein [Candidatus Omnitrophica bacterium]|nr:radical SAM protein [Candidatus Omnitrophota bacterium]